MKFLPLILVFLATTFNGLLAILNAHGLHQTQTTVIVAEISIVGASWAYALRRMRPGMLRWHVFVAVIVFIALFRALATGTPNVKYLRDILIIPTFVLLGLSCDRRILIRTVVCLHAFVIVVAVYEAISPSGYGDLFGVQSYYINTRNYSDDNFWNKGSDLFVNAERPQDRIFFPQLNWHREASVFLEPVSLGNYCVIVIGFLCACFGMMTAWTRAFLLFGTIFLIVACDGRVAFITSLGLVLLTAIAPYLPRRSSLITLPLVTASAFALVLVKQYAPGGDDFGGRLATTVDLLKSFDLQDLFGASDQLIGRAADSGIAYLILTQSLFGTIFIWLFVGGATRDDTPMQRRFTHATAFYLATVLMVSFSVFTIKTAALLWFIFGVLQQARAGDRRRQVTAPARVDRAALLTPATLRSD